MDESSAVSEQYQISKNEAVLLIEFQNEWVSELGWLRRNLITDNIDFNSVLFNAKTLLKLARRKNANIIHVTLQPDKEYSIFGKAKYGLRADIPKAGTWQHEMQQIHADFTPENGETVISERTGASAFSGSMLDHYLRNNRIDTLFLSGFATHVCVESTLREAHDRGYTCYVVTDATAAFKQEQQNYFENEILQHFGKGVKVSQLG